MSVGEAVILGVGVCVLVGVTDGLTDGVTVCVGVTDGVGVGVLVTVGVGVTTAKQVAQSV